MKSALAMLLLLATSGAVAEDRPRVVVPEAAAWAPGPVPGLQAAWLVGGEGTPGIYAVRVKLAAGARIPPHTHPDERMSLVVHYVWAQDGPAEYQEMGAGPTATRMVVAGRPGGPVTPPRAPRSP